MTASPQNLGTVRLLLSQAAKLCRSERRKMLLYFISMALAQLDSEIADAEMMAAGSRH